MRPEVEIYTDGACSGNPGPGGYGIVLLFGDTRREISGFEPETTNNRMELRGPIEGLRALKKPCAVRLYSDSAYLCNAFNRNWLANWEKNGWRKADGKSPVENQDLWRELLDMTQTHEVRFIKVAGHADNVENNRCDNLARDAIKEGLK